MLDRGRARLRYRIAHTLLIYGLIALVATIPLAVLTWGEPEGSWTAVFSLFSGLAALAAATVLGTLNLIYIRQSAGNRQSSRGVE